jgi:hypothetical protein
MTLPDKRWHAEGNCNNHPDPDLWHYENSIHADEQKLQALRSVEAITLCRTCPVKDKCLQEGLETENVQFWGGWGTIWGGLLLSERYKLLKHRDNEKIVTAEQRHRRDVRRILAKLYG